MSDIEIRLAGAADAESVASVLAEAAAWQEAQGTPMWNAVDLTADAIEGEVHAGLYWIARSGGDAVGCVRYQLEDAVYWPDAALGEAAYMHRLAVRRSHAGGGVSAALLDWAKAHARERGHEFLRLDCDAEREKLQAFYERHGFMRVGEREIGAHTVVLYECALTD